jgi:hypothetical protein
MSEINPDDYIDYQDEIEAKTRHRLKKRQRKDKPRLLTESLKQSRRQELESLRKERAERAEANLIKFLQRFPDINTDKGLSQAKEYSQWVHDSLEEKEPQVVMDEIQFKYTLSSAKAGGQRLQKKRTAVVAVHTPTTIRVRNEEERSAKQNKANAVKNLYQKLEEHLRLWKTLSSYEKGIDVEAKVMGILENSHNVSTP